jgi:hypothetical protein
MMATRKVTPTAEERETVRRLVAQDRALEAIKYLADKYRDAGLRLKDAAEAVFAIAPGARKRVATSQRGEE